MTESVEELIGGAEVSEDDLAWLAVDAAASDDLPVASSVNGLGNEAGHNRCSKYTSCIAAVKRSKNAANVGEIAGRQRW